MSPQPIQTSTPFDIGGSPSKDFLKSKFQGQSLKGLRTPAFVIDRGVFAENCARMQASSREWGASFRAHVKTHKTSEGVKHQLQTSSGNSSAVIVSTLAEAWGIVNSGLVKDGVVKDILYGLPMAVNKVQDLSDLTKEMGKYGGVIRVMIDHPKQVEFLEEFEKTHGGKWSAFIKVDGGQKRAGVSTQTPQFKELVAKALQSIVVSVYGFYCHAGNAYASTSLPEATDFLSSEVEAVNTAAQMAKCLVKELQAPEREDYVLSVGSTPTAHAASAETKAKLESLLHGSLELHAGNYPMLDLQQLHTSLIPRERIAQKVIATVISYYPARGQDGNDEAMCDAGAIALSKDTGPSGSFGEVVGKAWKVGRISQEHGILTKTSADAEELELGSTIEVVGQHACLIAAAYPYYYIVDSSVDGGDRKSVV